MILTFSKLSYNCHIFMLCHSEKGNEIFAVKNAVFRFHILKRKNSKQDVMEISNNRNEQRG